MCFMEGIVVGFSRKSDFKKHLQNFHHTNTIWVCQYAGCPMTFDFEKAYVTHVKAYHSDIHLPPNKARVELCPQLVFACGFRGCKDRVFEASSEEEAKVLRDKYFDHVAKHFDMGFCVGEWEYYTQIHNLLRQEAVKDMWKQCVWQKSVRNSLRWQPRSSVDLKRLLECRHLHDMPRLLHWAWTLGGEPYRSSTNLDAPDPPTGISRPLKRDCPLTASKHESLMKPALLKVAFPVSQQAFQFAIPAPKTSVPPTVYLADTRSSGSFSIKSNHSSLARGSIPEQDEWTHAPPPSSPYPAAENTQWGEGYGFAASTSEPVHHGPLSAAQHMEHTMNGGVPAATDHIQAHGTLRSHPQLQQPQPHQPIPHHQPYTLQHQYHPQTNQAMQHYLQHHAQQWPTTAMDGITSLDSASAYDHGQDLKTPKQQSPMLMRSLDNLRHHRRDGANQGMSNVPLQSSDYQRTIRAHHGGPASYVHEVSMTG
jgi:hypothetical protein